MVAAASPSVSAALVPPTALAWRVCAGCGVVAALSGTLLWSSTLGVFMGELQKAFGWTRAQIALGITLMTLTTPVLAPLAGWLTDRVDLRRLVLVSVVLQAAVLSASSLLGASIIGFYLLCIAMAAVAFGASVLPLSKIVIGWFDASRGKALGLLFACASLGPAVHPLLAQALVGSVGWRHAYVALSAAVLLLGMMAAWIWVRESASASRVQAGLAAPTEGSMLALLAMPAWWSLAAWGAFYAFGAGALNLHLYALMLERGASPAQAAGAASLLGLGLLLGNLAAGHLLDRLPARLLASSLMLAPVLAALALLWWPGVGVGLVASLVMGLAAGGESSALTYLVGRYFAPSAYGRAYATQTVPLALAAGAGPWVGGLLHGRSGAYDTTLVLAAGVFFIAALAPWTLRRGA